MPLWEPNRRAAVCLCSPLDHRLIHLHTETERGRRGAYTYTYTGFMTQTSFTEIQEELLQVYSELHSFTVFF